MKTRKESDALGEVDLPSDVYYGVHTARSLQNFDAAGAAFPIDLIHASVRLKLACARANRELGALPDDLADAIAAACERVLAGEFDDQFRIDVFQAGSGTSSNMNVNEVLANVANEQLGGRRGDYKPIHPNDHVNMGQSTNNIIPSAIRVAVLRNSDCMLLAAHKLACELRRKEMEFADIFKSGRTHLQDAVPVTLGQEFGAYARAVEKGIDRIKTAAEMLKEVGVGGNALGTGINTRSRYRELIIENLSRICGYEFRVATDGLEATQFLTDLARYSAALRLLAGDILKIGNDLRLLSSGPNTGLGEIVLPPVEPGSSIMPGKINPSICEAANMACMHVIGNDHAVSIAAAAGQLELNTHMPLIGWKLIDSVEVVNRCCRMLVDNCVPGIRANSEVCRANFMKSAGLATVLNPVLGYDRVSELVKEGQRKGCSVKELAVEQGLIDAESIEKLFAQSTAPQD